MSMHEKYKACEARMKELTALGSAMALLGWDQETMMPSKGMVHRAEHRAALAGVLHEKGTDHKLGELLRELSSNNGELDEVQRINVREWLRDYEHSVKIPTELAKELAKTSALTQQVWRKAREKSDFAVFQPHLANMIDLQRRKADALGYAETPYDALLDCFEPFMTVKKLDPILASVRDGLIPLAASIKSAGKKIDRSPLTNRYPEAAQERVCKKLIAAMGMDLDATRLDRSTHPFCSGISSPVDVRMTTRYRETWWPSAIFGTMHEAGHGLYDQGLDGAHVGTPMAEIISLGIHESQSRLWENLVGRSRAFAPYLFSLLKEEAPDTLQGVDENTFYAAVNAVEPSLIRVEADEVTYNLHVVLRYELEKGMIEGNLKAEALPQAWNERMETYFGITPPNDARGVLQDVHWSFGGFGYFPTYTLGNLYASQWWEKIEQDVEGLEEKISRGELTSIRDWLGEKIHRQGRRFYADDLVLQVTGKPLSAQPFLNYLRQKYA